MRRPIKFRGVMYGGNEKVYGDLVHENGHTYIINVAREHHRVYENSVAQLVGYDKDGNEVYEGDTLIDKYKTLFSDSKSTFVAELWSRARIYKFEINQLALKEDNQ